jgi:ABC-2 type transport system ATP-binding protein
MSKPERATALNAYGAGKTTLLRLLAGLAAPTEGSAAVLGGTPREDPAYLAEVGFLAQEIPLYRRLSAEDHIGIGAHLNPRWDGESVRERLAGLKIPLDRPAGTLSGGQRAQLALALTLAKRPRLLLDEPLAALDPLARQNFLATGIVPAGYAVFAMALGICAGTPTLKEPSALISSAAKPVPQRDTTADMP